MPSANVNFIGGCIAESGEPNEEFMNKHLNYYKEGKFIQDLKNLIITKQDFENLKKAVKKDCSNYEESFKSDNEFLKRIVRAIDYYLEHGLDEEAEIFNENKGGFKIDKKTTRARLANIILNMPQKFKSLEEQIEHGVAEANFIKKYGQKDKILTPAIESFYYRDELNRKILEEIDDIKFEDFVETVRSCDLVDEEKYEKNQKMLDYLREQIIQIVM